MNVQIFKRLPILGILRDVPRKIFGPLLETAEQAGLKAVEVTMNTPSAPELIQTAVRYAAGRFMVGAGTVLTTEDLKQALLAGATFVVMPVNAAAVVKECVRRKIPFFPGAFSPEEVYSAWKAGATMVKIFPARLLGPDYFRELRGPFKDIELLACGGVTPENLGDYFESGASAVTFGASVFRKEWLNSPKGMALIGRRIRQYIQSYRRWRKAA